ncbi:hypothetical protein ACHAWF_004770 [Thalassiosira exigua]
MPRLEDQWLHRYEELKLFKEQYGHCRVPREWTFGLGEWVNSQRSPCRRGKLNEDRLKRLDELGFSWDVYENKWDAMFDELEKYKRENRHCIVPQRHGKLGRWVKSQRVGYKEGKLPEQRRARLEKIGFRWSGRHVNATSVSDEESADEEGRVATGVDQSPAKTRKKTKIPTTNSRKRVKAAVSKSRVELSREQNKTAMRRAKAGRVATGLVQRSSRAQVFSQSKGEGEDDVECGDDDDGDDPSTSIGGEEPAKAIEMAEGEAVPSWSLSIDAEEGANASSARIAEPDPKRRMRNEARCADGADEEEGGGSNVRENAPLLVKNIAEGLQKSVSAQSKLIEDLQAQVDTIKKDLIEITEKRKTLENEVSKLREEATSQSKRIEDLEVQADEGKEEIKATTKKMKSLENEASKRQETARQERMVAAPARQVLHMSHRARGKKKTVTEVLTKSDIDGNKIISTRKRTVEMFEVAAQQSLVGTETNSLHQANTIPSRRKRQCRGKMMGQSALALC